MLLNCILSLYKYIYSPPKLPIWTSEGNANMNLDSIELDGPKTTPFERRFNPYDFNGG